MDKDSLKNNQAVSFFFKNSAAVVSLAYIYITLLGILYSLVHYKHFGINIFNYFTITDFFIVGFGSYLFSFLLPIFASVFMLIFVVFYFGRPLLIKHLLKKFEKEGTLDDEGGKWSYEKAKVSYNSVLRDMGGNILILLISITPLMLLGSYWFGKESLLIKTETMGVKLDNVELPNFNSSLIIPFEVIGKTEKYIFLYSHKTQLSYIFPNDKVEAIVKFSTEEVVDEIGIFDVLEPVHCFSLNSPAGKDLDKFTVDIARVKLDAISLKIAEMQEPLAHEQKALKKELIEKAEMLRKEIEGFEEGSFGAPSLHTLLKYCDYSDVITERGKKKDE